MFVYASHVLSEVSHELRTVEASSFVSSSKSTFWLILPFLLLFGSFEPFLKIFSYKKFSRVVVYCSVINVLFLCCALTSQPKYNIIHLQALSIVFSNFFKNFSEAVLIFRTEKEGFEPSRRSPDLHP